MGPAAFIGVDGGATRTGGILIDAQGRECASAKAGGAHYHAEGLDAASLNIELVVRALAREARSRNLRVAVTSLALAAARSRADRRAWLQRVRRMKFPGRLLLFTDVEAALEAATGGREGLVITCGTGSNVSGRSQSGLSLSLGGWGHLLGDEGSAYSIALDGLRMAVRSFDGRGRKSILERCMVRGAGVDSVEELPAWCAEKGKAAIASLAGAVFRAASRGDHVAAGILDAGLDALGAIAGEVVRRLGLEDDVFPAVLTGGVFENQPAYAKGMARRLRVLCPRASVRLAKTSAAMGAAMLGLKAALAPLRERVG